MKHKKWIWAVLGLFLLVCLLLTFLFRPMTMNDIYNEPNFSGVVLEASEASILVLVDEGEDEIASSDKMTVSLDVKLGDSMTDFSVGNHVKVFYDGTIAESYPAQINNVYAILLVSEEQPGA